MQPKPPVRPGRFLVGVLPDFANDSLSFMLDLRKYGDMVLTHFGPFPAYFVHSPELVHDVLVENANHYQKTTVTRNVLEPVLGNGIFTSEGTFWRRQRKLMQPAFHTRRIGAYGEAMTRFAEELCDGWQDGDTRMVDEEMAHLTMRIISKILFDAEIPEDLKVISDSTTKVLQMADERFNQMPTLPYWLPTRLNRTLRANIEILDRLIQRFIDEGRASGEDKGDLLSMLLAAQDDDGAVMTDKQVRDEAMTVFGAGHETTAVTLTWTWYLLSQNPQVEARLHDELRQVLNGRAATLADLPNLPYTEMIIKEAMRLYPPAWGTTREPLEDTTLGGYPIKKGSTIFINIYGMHRDARYFPDPDRFDPERWTAEREKDAPRYAYIPFGAGPRVCIGNALAMMEAKLVLATLAQSYRLTLAPGHVVKPQRMFTLRPQYGMKMIVHKRETIPAFAHPEVAMAGD
jgi:cytochrome P450